MVWGSFAVAVCADVGCSLAGCEAVDLRVSSRGGAYADDEDHAA